MIYESSVFVDDVTMQNDGSRLVSSEAREEQENPAIRSPVHFARL
jgi:hypothetical protein